MSEYPEELYTQTDYTFSKGELTLINTYATIQQMGEMAKALATNLINSVCIPRVGLSSEKEIGIHFDNTKGTFTVYSPRHWCTICKKGAGTEVYEKQYFCKKCIDLAPTLKQVLKENS